MLFRSRPYYEKVSPSIPPAPFVGVDHIVREGDRLPWRTPDAVVIEVPGHTGGSVAIHLPHERVLFTGDNVGSIGLRPVLGPFNVSRDDAIGSFRRLAETDVDIACFGHGDPVVGDATNVLRRAASRL